MNTLETIKDYALRNQWPDDLMLEFLAGFIDLNGAMELKDYLREIEQALLGDGQAVEVELLLSGQAAAEHNAASLPSASTTATTDVVSVRVDQATLDLAQAAFAGSYMPPSQKPGTVLKHYEANFGTLRITVDLCVGQPHGYVSVKLLDTATQKVLKRRRPKYEELLGTYDFKHAGRTLSFQLLDPSGKLPDKSPVTSDIETEIDFGS